MPKKRVYEVAKDLDMTTKDVIAQLKKLNIEVANHMSSLNSDEQQKLIKALKPEGNKDEQKKNDTPATSIQQKSNKNKKESNNLNKDNKIKNSSNDKVVNKKQENKPEQKNKPKIQGNMPQGNRQQAGGNKPQVQGNKPQGNRQQAGGNKPQVQGNKPQGNRQQVGGNKPQTQGNKPQANKPQQNKPKKKVKEVVEVVFEVPAIVTVGNFANIINKPVIEVIKVLMDMDVLATINQNIEFEIAALVAEELEVKIELEIEESVEDVMRKAFDDKADDKEDLIERPPVVVVMGHVDHGKTSLLDSIRKSKIASREAGGITQHIGAYMTSINGKPITFLDTPGHEAFTAMRMRGAQVTDVAILVVAADDGVMPQTIEAINHAKAAGIDIIIAINKIDKESANPERVKQELTEYGLVVEDWGGDTIAVPVSATEGTGIDNLLEMIILVSELKELKANPDKNARGTIVDALLDKGRGTVSTVLIQEGTLRVGDSIVAGEAYGKVRAMTDYKGRKIEEAGPSTPVEILGLSNVPTAGDLFYVSDSDKHARQVAESVVKKSRIDMIKSSSQKVSLEDLFDQIKAGKVKDLNIVIKADVQGSVEAVKTSLEKLSNEEVRVRTIHGGVGAITESDVMLASASNAIIIGFNVRPETSAASIADDEKVDMRLYRVIYSAIEDIQDAMTGMLDPIFEEKVLGHAEVRQLFKASKIGTIAGSYVTDGKITRKSEVRVLRDNIVVHEGELGSLRHLKDEVKEVLKGFECGILIDKYNDIKEGDIIEAFAIVEIPR